MGVVTLFKYGKRFCFAASFKNIENFLSRFRLKVKNGFYRQVEFDVRKRNRPVLPCNGERGETINLNYKQLT